jgi:adenine-specific DNA-methyltransferase
MKTDTMAGESISGRDGGRVKTDAFTRLQELLRELFQFDNKDLDFGIYRIMNHKRGAVEDFIQNGLAGATDRALEGGAVARQAAQAEELRRTTEQVKETFGEYAIDPKGGLNEAFRETPLGKEYLEALSGAGDPVDLEELKATIFNHVYTFFSRYYDNGDFLSKRRYSRRQKYAIPYNGEEVYLHWANADQYYIKTGEHFTDYRYKSPDGVTVHFELTNADTEQNNVKGDKRFFVPRPKEASYDEQDRTLTVPFEYRPLAAKEEKAYGSRNQQEKIIAESVEQLPARFGKQPDALAALVSEKRRNAKGEPVSLLEHHLRRYTRRNTSDFFVHKDLEGFLKGELDFYLKNEVLDVDDLESWGPDRSESWFEVMRAVKGVGRSIIAFLAQIEDFQKKLFEKKKLVVSAGYCLTLDRVPEELYEEVAANDAQREEWVRLFAIDEIEENITTPGYTKPLAMDFLKANPHLVLDTKFFGGDFVDRLLAGIEDLDGQLDGLLVESENFQALNLLQERYREQVKCIYIDPPYNTGDDDFLYKDSYQHSSWLTMLDSRLPVGLNLLSKDGLFTCSLDDTELANLNCLIETSSHGLSRVGEFVWKTRNTDNRVKTRLSVDHEYIFVYGYPDVSLRGRIIDRSDFKNPDDDPRGPYTTDPLTGKANAIDRPNLHYTIVNPETGDEFPPNPDFGWITDYKGYSALLEQNLIYWPKNPRTGKPRKKRFMSETDERAPISSLGISIKQGEGNIGLSSLFGSKLLNFPKPVSVMRTLVDSCASESDTTLDFFAGSGTTGHAVIDLNREDGGDRRYVLVEMGEYFDTVLKPRIL